ncbi:aquaporin-like protein [Leucogyrophana mollusca]|uniref:Aquaporin-like protein n=1 Tax=Leucogyrophana mollusca TaxID=85980 RepID=A0ACB8B4W0_9AGAM|nr:aquaporin-like protein [Leucogyrophana mollusca]
MPVTREHSSRSSATLFGNLRQDCKAAALEFVGTTFFLLLGLGGIQAASRESGTISTDLERVLYVATSMGLSLLVSAWLFFRVTGGLFNPNISLALLLVGVIKPVRFVLYCIAQLVGAIAASGLLIALTPGPLAVGTSLGTGINPAQGVFIEMFITAALVVAVLMLAAEKHTTTPFAPIGIGLTLFACHLWAVYYTGAGMNTARSFGPAAVTGFGYRQHWVYWVGPFLGSFLGSALYTLLKYMNYLELNPAQASMRPEDSPDAPAGTASVFPRRDADGTLMNTTGTNETRKLRTVSDSHEGYETNGGPV